MRAFHFETRKTHSDTQLSEGNLNRAQARPRSASERSIQSPQRLLPKAKATARRRPMAPTKLLRFGLKSSASTACTKLPQLFFNQKPRFEVIQYINGRRDVLEPNAREYEDCNAI